MAAKNPMELLKNFAPEFAANQMKKLWNQCRLHGI